MYHFAISSDNHLQCLWKIWNVSSSIYWCRWMTFYFWIHDLLYLHHLAHREITYGATLLISLHVCIRQNWLLKWRSALIPVHFTQAQPNKSFGNTLAIKWYNHCSLLIILAVSATSQACVPSTTRMLLLWQANTTHCCTKSLTCLLELWHQSADFAFLIQVQEFRNKCAKDGVWYISAKLV